MNQSYIYSDVSQLNKYYFITVQTKTNTKLNVYFTGNSINKDSAIYTDDLAIYIFKEISFKVYSEVVRQALTKSAMKLIYKK